MAVRDISKVMVKITDEEHWHSIIDNSNDKLIVVDIHQDWCGICEAIHPTLLRIYADYDEAESRIIVASANIAKLGAVAQASFSGDSQVNLDKNGCLPLFALYRHKSCVSVIVGVDGPMLLQQIALNIPDKSTKEE